MARTQAGREANVEKDLDSGSILKAEAIRLRDGFGGGGGEKRESRLSPGFPP
jgi:hypothetical protein